VPPGERPDSIPSKSLRGRRLNRPIPLLPAHRGRGGEVPRAVYLVLYGGS
jgi:hypothetical protein